MLYLGGEYILVKNSENSRDVTVKLFRSLRLESSKETSWRREKQGWLVAWAERSGNVKKRFILVKNYREQYINIEEVRQILGQPELR